MISPEPNVAPDGVPTPGPVPLRVGVALAGFTLTDLWIAQIAIGGSLTPQSVAEVMTGIDPDLTHHDRLVAAVNDHLLGEGLAYRVPSADPR